MLLQCAGERVQLRSFLCLTRGSHTMAGGASRGSDPFCGGGIPGGKTGRRLSLPTGIMREQIGEQAPIQPLTREKQEREKVRKKSMQHPALETIVERLIEHLQCE